MKTFWLPGCFLHSFSSPWHPMVLFVCHVCWPLTVNLPSIYCAMIAFSCLRFPSQWQCKVSGETAIDDIWYKAEEMICLIKITWSLTPKRESHLPSSHCVIVSSHCKQVARTQKYLGTCPKTLWPTQQISGIFPKMTNLWLLKIDLGFGNSRESFGAWT